MGFRNPSKARGKRKQIFPALPTLTISRDLSSWLPQSIIIAAILISSSVYLWPSPLEFPMDDTYIHFVYAENLAETGRLFFNFPDEVGVGSSSLLWVLILAAGNLVNLSMHWVAKLVGMAALAAVGIGLYQLLKPILSPWFALALSLLVILSGHMLWFALSGMETMLFLALGILALLCYREGRCVLMGILLGLLVITRIEGVILALMIGLFDIWRNGGVRRGLVLAGSICVLICSPWIMYLWFRTGNFLPTSGIGRHHSNIYAIQIATENLESLNFLSRFPALAYPLVWIGYSLEFILGGYSLPAPYLDINLGLGMFSYRVSIWAIRGLVLVVAPLIWVSTRRLVKYLRHRGWDKDNERIPLVIFLAWMVLHNLCYMIYLPIIGSASRYASLNHIALWLALGMGVWYLRRYQYGKWLAVGLFAIAFANMIYWNQVYDANLEHMANVRIAAADYINDHVPEDELFAASDVGALRFYGQRPLIDLGGLIDPDLSDWYEAGRLDQYLVENGVDCLALPGLSENSAGGIFDLAKEMGFSQSNLFDLRQEKVFEIDHETWLFGYLPTVNYQATVTLYTLVE